MTTTLNPPRRLAATALYVGAGLLLLTLGSYVLGIDHLLGFSRVAMAVVLVIAFVKVWLVTSYFMDLRKAPRWLGAIVNCWILGTCLLVIGLYLMP
jgi:heme/copper-type cytochrome/quinol oxidase subunit 4